MRCAGVRTRGRVTEFLVGLHGLPATALALPWGLCSFMSAVQGEVVSGCESGPSGILPVGPFFPPQSGRCQGCVLKNGMGLVPEVWPFSALDFMAYVWDPFGWLVQRKQCIVSMPLTSSVTLDTLCT